MKILDAQQQLIARADEVYKQYQFQQHFADNLKRKSDRYNDRWFKNSGKARVYKWRSEEANNIARSLYDYSVSLRDKAKEYELK